ncbi:MAG: EAL domain-containing protein, partial [Ruminiclostridium sp.]|nr:EAL domain-containing protein [Ruminiclostridium sp.]
SRRRHGVALWLGIWIAAALVQFFNNDILLVGFACSLGMLILFIMLENPDANIDRQAGCFHAHALSEYLRQSFMRQEPFGMISFSPVTKPEVNADSFEDILAFLKLHKNIKYFKNIYDEAVVVFREGYDCDAFIDEFGKYFGSSMKAYIVLLRNALPLNNTVNLLSVFEYMNRRIRSHANEYYAEISENTLSDYLRLSKMEDVIISAIANERIEIVLQPIYNVSLERFNSAEVLIRMKNDEGKYVSPSEFIPIAEETGIIVELGEIVFTKACEFLRDCRGKSGIDYLEINLSVVQCETPDLAERILAIMEEYGVNPDWINLEITETASTNMGKNFQANIQTLIDHGIKFSLDDFGKGESNLMYLVNVPVSIVKFDIDMTKAAYANPKAKYVMNYTVQMAHKLGMYTVAEGIESLLELEGMKETGIDYIQGYYFSRPLPPVDFMQFCESHLPA